MRAVIDTNVLVPALFSTRGAANHVFSAAADGAFVVLASPPLFLEYEEVLKRPEHRLRHGPGLGQVDTLLRSLATLVEPVDGYSSESQAGEVGPGLPGADQATDCRVTQRRRPSPARASGSISSLNRAAPAGPEVTCQARAARRQQDRPGPRRRRPRCPRRNPQSSGRRRRRRPRRGGRRSSPSGRPAPQRR